MFSPHDDVKWYAERFRIMKKVLKTNPGMAPIQQLNRTMLITTTFTVLFNERLAKSGKCL